MTHTPPTHPTPLSPRRLAIRLATIGLAFALGVLALAPSSASAGTTRLYQSSFGSFSDASPTDLAVDQSNGDVYVVGAVSGKGVLSRFDSTGAPKNFTAGPGAGTNTIGIDGDPKDAAVEIDNSSGPLDGSIYLLDPKTTTGNSETVKVYAPSGTQLGAIVGVGTNLGVEKKPPFLEPNHFKNTTGIAVDQSDGSLYVLQSHVQFESQGNVFRFTPASPSGAIDDADYELAGGITASHSTAQKIAADSGNVYIIEQGGKALFRYSVADFGSDFSFDPPGTLIDSIAGTPSYAISSVTVDPKTGEVYVNESRRIAVFDSAGEFLYRFGYSANFGSNFLYPEGGNTSLGIAVKSAASGPATKAYVSDRGNGGHQVDVFGPTTLAPSFVHEEIAEFGPDGTAASKFSSVGAPNQLAFDQAARRLFAVDRTLPGIYGFAAAPPPAFPPLGAFSPLGTAATSLDSGVAVDNTALASAGRLYLASQETDLIYGWSPAGAPLGGAFPIDPATNPGSPNGSPKDLRGAAVDSAGNIWVSNFATERILKYDSAGVFLGAIDTSAQGLPGLIALDSDDNLYVGSFNDGLWKYTAPSSYATAIKIAQSGENGLAVDTSNDHLFVIGLGWIDEYDAAGKLVDEFAVDNGSRYAGITVDATNHYIYASDRAGRMIRVFSPGFLFPEVETGEASDLANTTATLSGKVITQGVALTDCHFEYVTETAFQATGFNDLSSGGSAPCTPPPASIPLDLERHSVSGTATGLVKDAAYRFRLVASNADGTNAGSASSFSTAAPPIVETTGTPLRTTTTAQLLGRVDPQRAPVTYHFEYGTEGPCDSNPCVATEPQPAGSGDQFALVAQTVQGLTPDTTYHYRLIADNGNVEGPVTGQDVTVTTRASEAPLSHGRFPGPPGSDRAYELVTMPDSGGNPVRGTSGFSSDGNRALYSVFGGTPLSESGSFTSIYFTERPAGEHPSTGWQTRLITPPRDPSRGADTFTFGPLPDDLSSVVYADTGGIGSGLGQQIWRLSPTAAAEKLFETEPSQAFEKAIPDIPLLEGMDSERILVRLLGPPLDPAYPAAASVVNTYDVSSGSAQLVSLLPGNEVAACRSDGDLIDDSHVLVSSSGNSCAAPKRFYVRDLDAAQTVPLAPEPLSGPYCEPTINRARDGAVFFTSASRLLAEDTEPPANCSANRDVHRYDIAADSLECLTCAAPGSEANVSSVAIATDESRLYFSTNTLLLPGAPPQGSGIYRLDLQTDDLVYVAAGDVGANTFKLTRDGSQAFIHSSSSAYTTFGGAVNGATNQIYHYSDTDRSLVCVSCPQDGTPPVGGVPFAPDPADDGTLAFTTPTPLLNADQNTVKGTGSFAGIDVYEWRDGRLFLITDGLTLWPDPFTAPAVARITPSGRDLFFNVGARLTADAVDSFGRVYDARIGGGIAFPPPKVPCPLEVCQGIPKGAPEEQQPGTNNFSGQGNPAKTNRCPKGKVRKRSRCVKKTKPRPKRQRRANHDRRAQR